MDSSSKEQNYWPGFVDALSNVVLTLVFVLVVFVFALVISSNKVEQRATAMIQEAHERAASGDSGAIIEELTDNLEAAQEEIKKLQSQIKASPPPVVDHTTNIQLIDKSGLKVVGAVTITHSDNKITISFPKSISDLDPSSLKTLDDLLAKKKEFIADKKCYLRSYLGQESYSAAKRLAYYRILGLRNHIMAQEELKIKSVSSLILQQQELTDGRVEITFD